MPSSKIYIASLIAFLACWLPSDLARPTELGIPGATALKPVKPLEMSSHEQLKPLAVIPITPEQYVQAEATKYGWGSGYQWQALQTLLHGESGLNPHAVNPSSGACGLFQALPCSKMGVTLDNVGGQASWGMRYIYERYKSPSNALDFWLAQNPHWY